MVPDGDANADLIPADDESPLPRARPTVNAAGDDEASSVGVVFLAPPKSMREMTSKESSGMLSLLASIGSSSPGPARSLSLSSASLGDGASTAAARDRAASSCRRRMSTKS